MSIEKLRDLLKSRENSDLEKLVQRAQNMDKLTTTVRAGISPDMADNLISANLNDDGELRLLCATSAWASRIRFETDTILHKARESGVDAKTCVVRVCR